MKNEKDWKIRKRIESEENRGEELRKKDRPEEEKVR